MPTAAKLEKQASFDVQDPHKQIQILLDKKIRNLEKRKARLQGYRDLATAKNTELNEDQKSAIQKFDTVVEIVDFLKDFNKQISDIFAEHTKQQKKIAKKELSDRQQQEIERLKTIILLQDTLTRIDPTVREDFLNGNNGAIKLTEDELGNLDTLYNLVTPNHDTSKPESTTIEQSAEKLIFLAEGRSREAFKNVSFKDLKDMLEKIITCGYFQRDSSILKSSVVAGEVETEKNEASINSNPQNPSVQFQISSHPVLNEPGMSQISSAISFMNDDLKDPAVVSVNAVPFSFHQQFAAQTNDPMTSNSIPNSTTTSVNVPKVSNFDASAAASQLSSIQTQTFTNQNYATIMPTSLVQVPVTYSPTTLVHVQPIAVSHQDMSPHHVTVTSSDLGVGQPLQTYQNHQNFLDSNQDKHQTSQERGSNFNSDEATGFRSNNKNRGRSGGGPRGNQTNVNGFNGRARNVNKGSGGTFSVGSYSYQKFDGSNTNGSNFANNSYEKGTNQYNGNRGRQQNRNVGRGERAVNNSNRNFNPNNNYNSNASIK